MRVPQLAVARVPWLGHTLKQCEKLALERKHKKKATNEGYEGQGGTEGKVGKYGKVRQEGKVGNEGCVA